ncbi:hypothetical protein ACRAWD_26220 [Caulobacter segnis]
MSDPRPWRPSPLRLPSWIAASLSAAFLLVASPVLAAPAGPLSKAVADRALDAGAVASPDRYGAWRRGRS